MDRESPGEIASGFVAMPDARHSEHVRFPETKSEFNTGRERSLRGTSVPVDLNAGLAVFERHLQYLIGQVLVVVQFIQRLGEEFSLEREVHAGRRIETDQPRME